MADLFAPPTSEELEPTAGADLFAPPSEQELAPAAAAVSEQDLFAPPTEEESRPPLYKSTEQYPGEHEHLRSINAVSGREIQEIAAKNGVSAEKLREIAPYWRVGVEDQAGQGTPLTDDMKKFAGYLGASALDLPQYIYKLSQDENMRLAIDDLKSLAETRKTGVQTAGELGAGVLLPMGRVAKLAEAGVEAVTAGRAIGTVGKEVLTQAGLGAGIGGIAGITGSREGEELKEAAKGAAFGAGLGAALGAGVGLLKVGSAVKKNLGVPEKEAEKLASQLEQEMARPEVGEAIQRGETRVAQVAEGEAPALSIELDRLPVQKEIERLRVDDEYLAKAWQESPDILEEAARRGWDEETTLRGLAKEVVFNREASDIIQFAKHLETGALGAPRTAREIEKAVAAPSLREAGRTIEKWTKSGGRTAEFLRQEYRNWKTAQTLQDLNAEALKRGFRIASNELTRQGRKYFRVRGQFRIIDNRNAGITNLEALGDRLVEADNLKNKKLIETIEQSTEVLDESTRTGLREIGVKDLERLERGDLAGLSPEQQGAFRKLQSLFEQGRQDAGKAGVQIQQISKEKAINYVPRMQVDAPTTTGRIRARIQEIEERSGVSFKSHFGPEDMIRMKEAAPEAFAELIEGLQYLSGRRIRKPETLSKYATQALTVDGTLAMAGTKAARKGAGVARERLEVGIPSFLRETDLNKLYVRWNADVWKQAYWQKSVQELTQQRNLLAARGDRAGVEYVDWYLKKLAGGEQGVAKAITATRAKAVAKLTEKAVQAEAAGDRKAALVYRALSENSDVADVMTGIVYSNLLGLNPKSAMYNLVQPFVTTLPELTLGGNGWATAKIVKGYFKALASVQNPAAAREMLAPYRPAHLSDEMVNAFRTGVERGWVAKASRKVLDTYITASMSMMQSSETLNRLVTLHAADSVTKDLLMNSKAAQGFLKGMGAGYRREIQNLIAAGNQEGLQRVVRDYMIGKTMFHYSPLMTSQLGTYLGRLGSALSTWPTTITADIVGDFAKEGALGGSYLLTKKYLAPMAALTFITNWSGMTETPEGRALFGKEGLKGAAPIKAATDISSRGIVSSPFLEDAFKAFADAAAGDPEGWWKGMKRAGRVLGPGAGLVNFIEVTLPQLQGIEPERD